MAGKSAKKGRKASKSQSKKPKKAVHAKVGQFAHRAAPIVLPRKLPVESKKVVVVYGMRIDPEIITRAAIEAFNKKRYTVHDIKLTEYVPDPKFRNLMVKIALLDRIEEELFRLYPSAAIIRPNTVTLMAR
jgi:hypothetical protein